MTFNHTFLFCLSFLTLFLDIITLFKLRRNIQLLYFLWLKRLELLISWYRCIYFKLYNLLANAERTSVFNSWWVAATNCWGVLLGFELRKERRRWIGCLCAYLIWQLRLLYLSNSQIAIGSRRAWLRYINIKHRCIILRRLLSSNSALVRQRRLIPKVKLVMNQLLRRCHRIELWVKCSLLVWQDWFVLSINALINLGLLLLGYCHRVV